MSQFAIDPSLLSVPQRAPEDQFTNEAAQLSEEELKRLEERDRCVDLPLLQRKPALRVPLQRTGRSFSDSRSYETGQQRPYPAPGSSKPLPGEIRFLVSFA